MALVKCPGCGREVSSFSNNCNYCGHPISKEKNGKKKSGDNNEISSEEAERFRVKEKKSGVRRMVIAVIGVVVCILAFIGNMTQERLQQERRKDEEIESLAPKLQDIMINKERFLKESVEGKGDLYLTVYYGADTKGVKELLYEFFISKEGISDYIDSENFSLSDFEVFYEEYPEYSDINVQDIGNYYLLTIDYTGLDNAENVAKLVLAGVLEWQDENEDHEGALMDGTSFMNSLIENGAEKGFFSEKEYAPYFESGKLDNQ